MNPGFAPKTMKTSAINPSFDKASEDSSYFNINQTARGQPALRDGYALGRALRLDGIQKESNHRFAGYSDQNNCRSVSDARKLLLSTLRNMKTGHGFASSPTKRMGNSRPSTLRILKN